VIGVVTTSYPRTEHDAAGSFVRERVRRLRAGGAQVEVLAVAPGPETTLDGVLVRRLPATTGLDLFSGPGAPELFDTHAGPAFLAGAAAFSRLGAAVAERSRTWSAVESHWLVPSALAVVARGQAHPHRAHAHGGDVALLERLPCGRALARTLISAGATLVFVSRDLAARFARLANCPLSALQVEAAPLDLATFAPRRFDRAERLGRRVALGAKGRASLVLGVGRLVPVKGFDVLVRAVGRIPTARRPELVLLGEGPERERLRTLALSRGVSLLMPGALSRDQVAEWMAVADLYVQPSRTLPSGRQGGAGLRPAGDRIGQRRSYRAPAARAAGSAGGPASPDGGDGATCRIHLSA
jgi:glycosyltransferase involved in cell wall biosynthesis